VSGAHGHIAPRAALDGDGLEIPGHHGPDGDNPHLMVRQAGPKATTMAASGRRELTYAVHSVDQSPRNEVAPGG
jgi:hypothetical protein